MKTALKVFPFAILLAAVSAAADPLPDSAFMNNKAGWFISYGQSCPTVCKQQLAQAEREAYSVPAYTNARTHVCKVYLKETAPIVQSGWLYGNNFDSPNYQPYCMVGDIAKNVKSFRQFFCLCVKPALTTAGGETTLSAEDAALLQ